MTTTTTTTSTRIESLNRNDVILGRGSGPRSFIGNKRFHELVATRRQEYLSCYFKEDKRKIANEIVQNIMAMGGRFVKQTKKGKRQGDLLVGGVWEQVPISVAVEKAKQALREQILRHQQAPGSIDNGGKEVKDSTRDAPASEPAQEMSSVVSGEPYAVVNYDAHVVGGQALQYERQVPAVQTAGLGMNPLTVFPPAAVDARVMLFQRLALLPCSQEPAARSFLMAQNSLLPLNAAYPSYNIHATNTNLNVQHDNVTSKVSTEASSRKHRREETRGGLERGTNENNAKETNGSALEESGAHHNQSNDDEAAAFVLATLALEKRPKMTMEELEREQTSLTNEERAAALADVFGKMNVDGSTVPQKKARKDLDQESIEFLIRQMRREIDKIPNSEKEALLEAQAKCRLEEFSDSRLERFLRVEGMNVELAAKRIVGYWKTRKEIFGPTKFTLRLTLSEALRDDVAALEAGVYHLLPHKDSSGRQILLVTPSNHDVEAYTSDSLLRAFWYISEVASSRNTHARCGMVDIVYMRGFTIFDYDHTIFDVALKMYHKFMPVKQLVAHICCPSSVISRYFFPIINAAVDKFSRSRAQIHDVEAHNLVDILNAYGIHKVMLPTIIGGTVELDPVEWVAQQRADEMSMEELS